MRRKHQGFSLIELLIVVAIILIIAAIAIPNLIRSKMSANEASAVASIRSINTACVSYSTTYGLGYPTNLSNLGPVPAGANATSDSADLIDSVLAAGSKSGYSFTYAQGNSGATYSLTAQPTVPNTTGTRYFYTDQTGVIRQNVGAPADPSSSPLD